MYILLVLEEKLYKLLSSAFIFHEIFRFSLKAPLSLFHLNSLDEDFELRFATVNPGDNEDPHDEYYLLSTRPKHTEVCRKLKLINVQVSFI